MIESLLQGAADLLGIGLSSTALILLIAAWYLWRGKRFGGSVAGLAGTAVRDAVFLVLALAALMVVGVASVDVARGLEVAGQAAQLAMEAVQIATELLGGGVL